MKKEWADRFNSFNSDKGFLFAEYYQAIADWVDGKRDKPMQPIEVSFDPVQACNLHCDHCNAHRYLEDVTYRMTDKHIIELVEFFADWGVKTMCLGGGGEPTLHTKLPEVIRLSKTLGMENSLVTNGTLLTPELIESVALYSRYAGVSVDSATPETYERGKGKNLLPQVLKNIASLVESIKKHKSNCSLSFKFLVAGYNQHEIFKACQIAKDLGVRDFHVRPTDFRHQGLGEWKKKTSEFNVESINEQFEKCHAIEDENFRVYSVLHKFNDDLTPKRNFTQCYASPVSIQVCADGNIYYCPDTRFLEFYILGTHTNVEDIKKMWGNDHMKELVTKTACQNCTSRCTFTIYNEICERLFINKDDPMYRWFV